MFQNPFESEDDTGITFRDMITLALAGFVTILLVLLPHINPPLKDSSLEIISPGSLMVEAIWPNEIDADVDLWVKAPGDMPVGYSNQGGKIFNLLRDDLGNQNDVTNMNYENVFSRGIPPGEYVVNLHLFSNPKGTYPVPVKIVISTRLNSSNIGSPGILRQILKIDVDITRLGQELTVIRFKLDDKGNLIAGSENSLFTPLRAKALSGPSDYENYGGYP